MCWVFVQRVTYGLHSQYPFSSTREKYPRYEKSQYFLDDKDSIVWRTEYIAISVVLMTKKQLLEHFSVHMTLGHWLRIMNSDCESSKRYLRISKGHFTYTGHPVSLYMPHITGSIECILKRVSNSWNVPSLKLSANICCVLLVIFRYKTETHVSTVVALNSDFTSKSVDYVCPE